MKLPNAVCSNSCKQGNTQIVCTPGKSLSKKNKEMAAITYGETTVNTVMGIFVLSYLRQLMICGILSRSWNTWSLVITYVVRSIFNIGPSQVIVGTWSAPTHYLYQCWFIISWIHENKLQCHSNQNTAIEKKVIWKFYLLNVNHIVQNLCVILITTIVNGYKVIVLCSQCHYCYLYPSKT